MYRVPARLQPVVDWMMANWPGRIFLRSAATVVRIELFDRSMTIAAQLFTSIFPVLLTLAVLVGRSRAEDLADAVNMPDASRAVLEQALADRSNNAFAIVGFLVVLISATSLSRALTRAFAVIWDLPRPKSRLSSFWRWVAVVLTLALFLLVVRALGRLVSEIPPKDVWGVLLTFGLDVGVALFVPWLLLARRVPARLLLPGAVVFGIVMLIARPATTFYMPHALEASANRYGSIGVAFTYLAWLYVVALIVLAATVIGQVVATDEGWIGRRIRGEPLSTEPAGTLGAVKRD
jgi:membrane protein